MDGNFIEASEKNSSPVGSMKVVADLGGRGRWLEILSQEDANRACLLSQTAIHIYYSREGVLEGGHPRRWFVLVNETDPERPGPVCLVVTPPGAELQRPDIIRTGVHTTGFQNANPYPEHAEDIEALANVIGVPIEPNWMGGPADPIPGLRP